MNKLKEQLRLRMLGQLSDEKTNIDINNAYSVAVDFSLSFLTFVARKFEPLGFEGSYFKDNLFGYAYSKEELMNIFIEEYERKV